jgi:hypothetical protein
MTFGVKVWQLQLLWQLSNCQSRKPRPKYTVMQWCCIQLFTFVYICLQLYTFVYICIHLFTFVYICIHLYTFVYICIHLFTFVYIFVPLLKVVYLPIHPECEIVQLKIWIRPHVKTGLHIVQRQDLAVNVKRKESVVTQKVNMEFQIITFCLRHVA